MITGYGILKTTEDHAPVLVQRRNTRQTAFVWAIALDGRRPELEVSAAEDSSGKTLPLAEAALVRISAGKKKLSLLVNPGENKVTGHAGTSVTDKRFSVIEASK